MARKEGYDEKIDTYAAGVLLFELLTGSPPFRAKEGGDPFDLILGQNYAVPDYVSEEARDLLSRILVADVVNVDLFRVGRICAASTS